MLTIAGRPSLVQDLASATVGLLLFGLVILGAISLIKLVGRRLQGGTTAEAAPPVEDAVLPPGEDGALAEVRRSATVLEEELEYGAGTVAQLLHRRRLHFGRRRPGRRGHPCR